MREKLKNFSIRDFIKNNKGIVAAVVFVLLFNYTFTTYKISGNSMLPNYHDGNFGIAFKHGELKRFDVVIAKNYTGVLFIKRVIGLPNEKVVYRNNELFVNDKKVETPVEVLGTTGGFEITLKDEEYFLMGDNRERSTDSRLVGPFKRESIIGKVLN